MRYICIHGHFYQPPRENPWLEAVERQESAWPAHDWNERVQAECYGPNAMARILDHEGCIERIVNNYENISFNFGPTLLSWMQTAVPETYRLVQEADREARKRRYGAGSALAQVYGHLILPLANARDKQTQVLWGIRDFELRFGRKPRGMWLAETACDTATLEVLALNGIEFTILAPHQCRRVRARGGAWVDVTGARVDTRRAYECELPSGRKISLLFYDGPTSRAIAFERLLNDGTAFANRLIGLFDPELREPQLVHVATDGETYGHHHRFGEMALAYAIQTIEEHPDVELVTYEEYLDRHPPEWQCDIVEATSWSCAHGVERWRSNCSCRIGGPADWTQAWRAPLRNALDWLRDQLAPLFERESKALLNDPWRARDAYIDVVLDRSDASVRRFLQRFASDATPDSDAVVKTLRLLEMQRHAMLMYTSCGWFFDDLGGIETVQVIEYAARAVQLAQEFDGAGLEEAFVQRLALAHSNVVETGSGKDIYEKSIRPRRVDLLKVGAHYGASSLFTYNHGPGTKDHVHCYGIEVVDREHLSAGTARLAYGKMRVRSAITWETEDLIWAALRFGDHNLSGGVRPFESREDYESTTTRLRDGFSRADLTEVIHGLEKYFANHTFSLRTLFRDEQKRILDDVLASTLEGVERSYEQIYAQFAPLMRYLASLEQPVPRALHQAAEYTLTARLRRELERHFEIDFEVTSATLREARDAGVKLNKNELGLAAQRSMERLLSDLLQNPDDRARLAVATRLAEFASKAELNYDLSVSQNRFYGMRETLYRERQSSLPPAPSGAPAPDPWLRDFQTLGRKLKVRT